jgi:putative hydrolase of the HAD superfamily
MIKLFVFDLGNVILPFDNRTIADKLHSRSASKDSFSPSDIFEYLFDWENGAVNGYEEGLSSSLEFFSQLKERYALDLGFDEFKDIWNNIFTENGEVKEIVSCLKAQGFPLFLLSNTNELHFNYILERYPVVSLMDEFILSHEVGAKKPKQRMYDAIFERTDAKADEIFYVDDMEPYIERAREIGMRGLVFRRASDLRNVLAAEGICEKPICRERTKE